MRIAIISETFLPKVDGIVNTLCHLLDYLAQRNDESLLLAPEGGPDWYARTCVVGLRALPFPFYPELKLAPPLTDITAQLSAFQPEVIHVMNSISIGLAGLRYARQYHVPAVASYQTDIPGFAARWGYGFLREPLWAYLRWIHSQADLNLVPSTATYSELQAQGFERLRVWGRGVDCQRFHPSRRSMSWRMRLSDGHPDAPLLLFVGRVAHEKRIDWLRAVLDELPEVRLAIVGGGPARVELQRLFGDGRTIFTGYLSGLDLACAYAAADVFVFPSANETFGNVLLEAMASGLPVVAAASGGPLDVVRDGETGLFFEPEVKSSLVRTVSRVLADDALARNLSSTSRADAEGRSWGTKFGDLLACYASILPQRPLQRAA